MSNLMSDATRRELMAKYSEWRALGSALSHRENSYKAADKVDAGEWQAHDDEGRELCDELASYLFDIEDCGHQNATTVGERGTYVVTCDDCPVTWTVKNGEVVKGD